MKDSCRFSRSSSLMVLVLVAGLVAVATSGAQDTSKGAKDRAVALADGQITMKAPENWERTQPRVTFIEHEFIVPGKDDQSAGRVTVMGAGGSVKENTDRWLLQFPEKQGEPKIEKKKIAGVDVHIVDVSGTYNETRGPFAPATVRKNYRMLGAIIDTEGLGRHFVKFTGPSATVAAHEKAFQEMLQSLQLQK